MKRIEELWKQYYKECDEAAAYCEEQGWPGRGSNYELMVDRIREGYPELFDPDYEELEPEKHEVMYSAGPSRETDESVDFMLVEIDDTELYAEMVNESDDETDTYDDLRAEIIRQAKLNGIDPDTLHFMYDNDLAFTAITATVIETGEIFPLYKNAEFRNFDYLHKLVGSAYDDLSDDLLEGNGVRLYTKYSCGDPVLHIEFKYNWKEKN